jgi:ribose-phosphate pyrophosphokinase
MITIHNVYDVAEATRHVEAKSLFFPGGEPHFELLEPFNVRDQYIWVNAPLTNANDLVELLAAVDAIKRAKPARLGLFIPYFPAARQDRLEPCRAFTLKIYADLINRLEADCVVVADPHSDVTPALLNNCKVIKQSEIVSDAFTEHGMSMPESDYIGVIAPDLGAAKKANEVAAALHIPCIQAKKKRDPKTGALSGFDCELLWREGKYLMVDDIADGGGTFIGLLDYIRRHIHHGFDSTFDLYTTHGIYSKGREVLLSKFNALYSTDSFTHSELPKHNVISLHGYAASIFYKEIAR